MQKVLINQYKNLPSELMPQAAPMTWEAVFKVLPNAGKVLVAGAGRGGISHILKKSGYDVISADLHPDHFVAPDLTCVKTDFNLNLPFQDAYFESVVAVEVIEHLENPWLFFREAIRVLENGGVLIVTSPNVNNIVSRINFLLKGTLPYFRRESFEGCYHVSPIFSWSIERFCLTTSAILEKTLYSRHDWPKSNDVPRHDGGKGFRRRMLDIIPCSQYTGEISCYVVRKTNEKNMVNPGVHYS